MDIIVIVGFAVTAIVSWVALGQAINACLEVKILKGTFNDQEIRIGLIEKDRAKSRVGVDPDWPKIG